MLTMKEFNTLSFSDKITAIKTATEKRAKSRKMRVKRKSKARKAFDRIEFLRANLLVIHNPKQKRKIIKTLKKLSAWK